MLSFLICRSTKFFLGHYVTLFMLSVVQNNVSDLSLFYRLLFESKWFIAWVSAPFQFNHFAHCLSMLLILTDLLSDIMHFRRNGWCGNWGDFCRPDAKMKYAQCCPGMRCMCGHFWTQGKCQCKSKGTFGR